MWLLIAFLGLSPRGAAQADNILGPLRTQIRLPEAGMPLEGFTVQLDVGKENAAGYVPVKIVMKAAGRFPADRRFLFRFISEPELESPTQNGLVVNVPIMVDQNATSQTFIRYLPKWSAGQAVSVVISEEGRDLDGYDTFFGGERLAPSSGGRVRVDNASRVARRLLDDEYKLNWIFVTEADHAEPEPPPALSEGVALAGRQAMSAADREYLRLQVGAWPQNLLGLSLQTVGQLDLPADWRAYQRFDVILIKPEGLQRLRSQAAAFQAVRDWVLNGGTVVVYNAASARDVVEDFGFAWSPDPKAGERIESIAYQLSTTWQQQQSQILMSVESYKAQVQILRTRIAEVTAELEAAESMSDPAAVGADDGAEDAAAESTETSGGVETVDELVADEAFEIYSPFPNIEASQDLTFLKSSLQAAEQAIAASEKRLEQIGSGYNLSLDQWSDQIKVHGAGAGGLIAIAPLAGRDTPTTAHWGVVRRFLDHRASATLRRGVDPLIGDRRFARWMIPGVAQPPVYTFMGLLTVFVILVGPIAYRRTSKMGRSYLMFAIAPVLALLTTVAMFGYGIIADGFGTRVRVRQLTWVDGKSGDAGERVRSTYFAGVRPAAGLRFAGDAELMLYREGTGQSWEDLNAMPPAMLGRVTVDEESQRLDASFLPSRQQRQFVVHAPRRDVGSLQLTADPQGTDPPDVSSSFTFTVRQGVLRDEQANYWLVENLGPGEAQSTKPLTTRDASKLMGQLYNDHRPIADVSETRSKRSRYNNQIYDLILDINRTLETTAAITEGLFELWLQQHLQTNGEIPRAITSWRLPT